MTDISEFVGSLPLKRRPPLILGEGFKWLIVGAELVLIVGCSLLSGIVYQYLAYGDVTSIVNYARTGLLAALFFLFLQSTKSRYDPGNISTGREILKSVTFDWTVAWVALLICGFLTKTTAVYSRGTIVLFYFSGLIGIALVHGGAAVFLRRAYRHGMLAARKVLLVGAMERVRRFQQFHAKREHGVEVAGVCILPNALWNERRELFDQILEKAVRLARQLKVDGVVCLIPWGEEEMVERCTTAFLSVPASIHLGTTEALRDFRDLRVTKIGAALCLELARAPLSSVKRLVKRVFDLTVAISALLVLWPFLLLVSILIKLDSPGPVLFLQRRYGFNNEVFRIVKFRTMTTMEDGQILPQATRNDPRVTRIGRFLRRWNIDELPQLFNVIAGSMSIVGPRPHAMSHNHEFERKIALYARRHSVKPGITGWAQVKGFRGITDTEDKIRNRVAHDLYYIDNWSLGFDLYIMALTLISPRTYANAY